jgi:hypothetical protein
MTRVSLSRLPRDRVLVVDGDVERAVAVADLPAYVQEREAGAPRWVWDDTARWYPPLLAAGVRVERCHDLRLCHHLLRRAPAVDGQLLVGEQSEHWDRLGPSTPSDPALFSVDDTTEHLRADLEDARQSAAVAAAAEGKNLEVIDLRSLSPLDLDTVAASVEKTGRTIVVHEASTFLGLGAEIAAALQQRCFYHLEAPVLRVGGYNLPYPPSKLEEEFLPDLDRVLDAVDRSLAF